MNDPFIPRHPAGTTAETGHGISSVDLLRTIGLVFRGIAFFVTLGMFFFGAYYAVDVFLHIGSLVKNPINAQAAIDQLAEIIDGEQLVVAIEGKPLKVGRLAATLVYGFGCLLWAWVPLTIMSVSGRLLMVLASGRRPPPPAPQPKP